MPLLLLPSFFTNAISQALLPVVSRAYADNNKKYRRRIMKKFWSLSFKYSKNLIDMLIGIIIYIVIGAIAGALIWVAGLLTGWIPVVGAIIGWIIRIISIVVEVWVVIGIVLSVLATLKIVK